MDMKADDCLPREQSHLKIRLLDESDLLKESEHGSSQSVTAPQRECKDEAYVTMSSLFKTQWRDCLKFIGDFTDPWFVYDKELTEIWWCI